MPTSNFLFQVLELPFQQLTHMLFVLALCSIRMMVVFLVLPATSDETVTGTARNGVIYMMSLYIMLGQPKAAFDSISATHLIGLGAKEAVIGLLLGYAASTIFWTAESIGTIVDDMSGYNNVQMTNPLRGDQSTPVSSLMLQLAITLFYALGGMIALVGTIFASFHWWPIMQGLPSVTDVVEKFMLKQTDDMFTMIVKMASPIMLMLVLIDIGIGLISRTAEKLEPSNLSQPIRGVIALLLLAQLCAVFIDQVKPQLALQDFSSFIQHGIPAFK